MPSPTLMDDRPIEGGPAQGVVILNAILTVMDRKSSVSNTPSIISSAGDAIAANASRRGWAIQNLGTNPLFVRLGTGASSTVFHRILKGNSIADDGTGGIIEDEAWIGIVSVAGTSPRFVATELI